jgi:carboxypeptidase C (cathepsin A)
MGVTDPLSMAHLPFVMDLKRFLLITFGALVAGMIYPVLAESTEPKALDETKAIKEAKKTPEPVVTQGEIKIDGKSVPYKATAGTLTILKDDGTPRAKVFHVSYERSDVKDAATRPVMFAFNGGPGSSAVWLHIGMLGPRIIQLPGDGSTAPKPPVLVSDNPFSILDVCDLVFVDPVSTGYSRATKDAKPSEFHGVREDVESVGDFVRRWITEHDRWASPKFLLGESYGGIRVAGLSNHLQSRYGMSLNGVVLLSCLLDFATLQESPGHDLSHLVFLPTYATVAHWHGKVQGDRDELAQKAKKFAFGEYATALLEGKDLPKERVQQVAQALESLTGVPAQRWQDQHLRLSPFAFRAELLRAENKTLGRFDGRVAWVSQSMIETISAYDPSYSLALGAFSTAMLDYLGRELKYKEEQPYEILTGKVSPWRWDSENQRLNVSPQLASAMRDNPALRVLVMAGHTDLATPPEGIAYSLRHLPGLPGSYSNRIETVFYDAGHMFYLNPPDLKKSRTDLVEFISSSLR